MTRLTLTNIAGAYASTTELNANFALIELELDKVLYLDGTLPNVLTADLDMNSNDITNGGIFNCSEIIVNGVALSASVVASAASAAAALVSENNAATSETNAASSASAASTSETNAASSASAASTSETNAASSESTASAAATAAGTSETNAATSETNADADATATAADAVSTAADAFLLKSTALGALSSDPTLDGNGNAVTTGDWYFNTTSVLSRVYNGSTWQNLTPGVYSSIDDSGVGTSITIDSSNNIGFSASPSAFTLGIGMNVGTSMTLWDQTSGANFADNLYYDGAFKRKISGGASRIFCGAGKITLSVAASAAADTTITWINTVSIERTGHVQFQQPISITVPTTAGSANTYTSVQGILALTTGVVYYSKVNTTNTGTSTLNVDSIGAKTIKTHSGANVLEGQLRGGTQKLYEFYYDGTFFVLLNPSAVKGTWTPEIYGKDFDIAFSSSTATGNYIIEEDVCRIAGVIIISGFNGETGDTYLRGFPTAIGSTEEGSLTIDITNTAVGSGSSLKGIYQTGLSEVRLALVSSGGDEPVVAPATLTTSGELRFSGSYFI